MSGGKKTGGILWNFVYLRNWERRERNREKKGERVSERERRERE